MKKIGFIAIALLLIGGMGVFAGGRGQGQQQLRFATGGTAGVYFAYGSALSAVINDRTGLNVLVQSTGASRDNILLLNIGEVELAFSQSDVAYYAWNGVDLFAGDGQIRVFNAIGGLYSEVVQVVARAGIGIESIEDLRGRAVSVGAAGSGTVFNATHVLAAHGLSFDDINVQYLGFGPSADALRDGHIDAAFLVAGAPTPALVDLALTNDIVILPIVGEAAQALMRDHPFYTVYVVEPGIYNGVDIATYTVAVRATLLASTRLSEDVVYQFTRALFENQPEIATAHARGAELNPHDAVVGMPVPIHPGAARFFRSVGALP
ncbi:MAG: TAXI family TRAP transporter solute-binding subunit [Spirochaetes bacterium]|nr:TAXI family TRAP transporter solute-binding subunit [Spirochaetota bacterium]